MLIDLLLDAFQAVIMTLLSPLPTHEIEFVSHLETVADNLTALNYFLPISETITVVLAVMLLFPVFFGVNFALFCIAFLRGGSSRG